ncbi:MAG: rhodanese-like domain-containing protein [Burkholderiales bacterium]|jgi:rhodanese-related sulfurtransferase|nr:rhodanese-like domain-containing protein [Burkholderiales bacterium]
MRSKASIATDSTRRLLVAAPLAAGVLYMLGRSDPNAPPAFNVKEVLLDEARALIAAGAWVVDVRERAAYEVRHLPGAVLAPVSSLAQSIPAALAAARELPVLVYCGDGRTIGPKGTHLLNAAGFAGAVNLKPGIQGWADAGLPIEKGAGRRV